MATWNPEANSIFLRAVEIQPSDERAAFLGQACGADAGLRAQVEDLLQAHTAAHDFLEQPAISPEAIAAAMPAGETCAEHPSGPASGTQIGPYKLLQRIGEGGMGSVWLAEQQYPVRRQVA